MCYNTKPRDIFRDFSKIKTGSEEPVMPAVGPKKEPIPLPRRVNHAKRRRERDLCEEWNHCLKPKRSSLRQQSSEKRRN